MGGYNQGSEAPAWRNSLVTYWFFFFFIKDSMKYFATIFIIELIDEVDLVFPIGLNLEQV